jgi:hypothetical protein
MIALAVGCWLLAVGYWPLVGGGGLMSSSRGGKQEAETGPNQLVEAGWGCSGECSDTPSY